MLSVFFPAYEAYRLSNGSRLSDGDVIRIGHATEDWVWVLVYNRVWFSERLCLSDAAFVSPHIGLLHAHSFELVAFYPCFLDARHAVHPKTLKKIMSSGLVWECQLNHGISVHGVLIPDTDMTESVREVYLSALIGHKVVPHHGTSANALGIAGVRTLVHVRQVPRYFTGA